MNNATTKAAEAAANTTTTTLSWNVDLGKLGIPPAPADLARKSSVGAAPAAKPERRSGNDRIAGRGFDTEDLLLAALDLDPAGRLTFVEKWVLVVLSRYADLATLTQGHIAAYTKLNIKTVRKTLRELAESGWIAWYRAAGDKEANYLVNVLQLSSRSRALAPCRWADLTAFWGDAVYAVGAKCDGLSAVEKVVLVAACARPAVAYGITQRDIAKATGLSRSAVGRALRTLEDNGWVTCQYDHCGKGGRLLYAADIGRIKAEEDAVWRGE